MSNIYERIGRAISSCGLYDIIRAETQEEVEILEGCDFKKVGSMLEGEKVVSLYKIEPKIIEKVVQVPIISPTIKPYPPIDTSPWEYPGSKPNLPGIGAPWVSNEPYTAKFSTGDAPEWSVGRTTSDIKGDGIYSYDSEIERKIVSDMFAQASNPARNK